MTPVTLQEARVRLEGELEVLEAAHARYQTIFAATHGAKWKQKIDAMSAELEVAADAEAEVERALDHAERRALADGWAPDSPPARFVDELRDLRFNLLDRLAQHNPHRGNDGLAMQMRCCAAWALEEQAAQARGAKPDERVPQKSWDTFMAAAWFLIPLSIAVASFQGFSGGLRVFLIAIAWLASLAVFLAYRAELRIFFAERRIERWSGLFGLSHDWTVRVQRGTVLGVRGGSLNNSTTFTFYAINDEAQERTLETFTRFEDANDARAALVKAMDLPLEEDLASSQISEGNLSIVRIR